MLPSPRILLGPGPSMADPRVLRAMATPLLGQFDPEFTAIMDEVMALSRLVFQTASARTFPVSGTGRAGLEAAMVSLLEPGDRVVIGECGRFGLLLEDLARRCEADAVVVRAEWGQALDPVAIEAALAQAPTKVLAVVHGETSTGVLQPLADLGRLARAYDALLVADVVVTLGGAEVALDAWDVDVAVGGTQKCLSCPSGLAPVAYKARAPRRLRHRDRCRLRSAAGQSVADRYHGVLCASPERPAPVERSRAGAASRGMGRARRGGRRRRPGSLPLRGRRRLAGARRRRRGPAKCPLIGNVPHTSS